jgi:hypothetical protein
MKLLIINNVRKENRRQNLILITRWYAVSGISTRGTRKFPNPPIINGITAKKIMIKAIIGNYCIK